MKRLLAVLSFCLVAASCQEGHPVVSNPIVPTPPILETPPKPPMYPPESWTLTASVTSVTPHPCWRDLTGLTDDFALNRASRRGDASVRLLGSNRRHRVRTGEQVDVRARWTATAPAG